MQFLNIELAWWFNVGVQVFLCISGFLYGQKNIGDVIRFYHRRLEKILIPYYLVYIPFGVCEYVFARDSFVLNKYIKGLLLNSTISGAEHLWFIPTILMCYLITPLLQIYRDKYIQSEKHLWIYCALGVGIVSIFFECFSGFFNPAWMSCYVLGYALGVNEKNKLIKDRILVWVFGTVALFGNSVQIICSYIAHIRFPGFNLFCNYNHVMLGVLVFLLLKKVLELMDIRKLKKILSVSDEYSYEVYLVHQLIILGPFSLMNVTNNVAINYIIILVGICFLAIALKQFEEFVRSAIFRG